MFFIGNLSYIIVLEPRLLGPEIKLLLNKKLLTSVEGTCNSDHGYIISVLSIDKISEGRVCDSGEVQFLISYRALLLKPLKGEVLDASVVEVNKMGIFASVGPLNIFISNYQIPQSFVQQNEVLVDGSGIIGKDTCLRLKIIGTKIEPSRIYAIGTINEDNLGVIC